MHAVRIVTGDDVDQQRVVRRLASALVTAGNVAIIEASGRVVARTDGSPSVTTVDMASDDRVEFDLPYHDTSDLLDTLCDLGFDYVLVGDGDDIDLPTVVVDQHLDPTDALLSVGDVDDLQVNALHDALEEVEPIETLSSLVERIQAHPDSPKAGAIATFTGRVRVEHLEGERTTHLEYEKYEGVADAELAAIRRELTARDGVYEVLLHHRTGIVEAEDDAVYVVVLAGHRPEAFRAVEDGIDLLKERVPIFKKEVTESGDYWAHDRP